MRWEYYCVYCHYEVTEDHLLESDEGAWFITIEGADYEMADGLAFLGDDGWELVAVQQAFQPVGGAYMWKPLNYWHIFKRPYRETRQEA